MVQSAGRVTCPKCGANNFDTVTTCYRCNASLITGAARPSAGTTPNALSSGERVAMPAPSAPQNYASSASPNFAPSLPPHFAPPPYNYGGGGGDPGVARRAAILLALTIPFLGLPVGWIFMMMEDQKRQAIGRLCANWSLIALVFHMLLSFVFLQSLSSYLPMILNLTKAAAQGQQNPQRDMGGSGMP